MTGEVTPAVFALASDDKATPGAVDSNPPAQAACEEQVWPRFSPGCLTRNGEASRPVRLIERNRLAESTPAPRPERTVVRGRETVGLATPAAAQAQPEAPVATQAEKPRRAKRSRKSRERDVARNREAPAAAAFNQVGARQPVGFGQPFGAPAMAYSPEPARRTARPPR